MNTSILMLMTVNGIKLDGVTVAKKHDGLPPIQIDSYFEVVLNKLGMSLINQDGKVKGSFFQSQGDDIVDKLQRCYLTLHYLLDIIKNNVSPQNQEFPNICRMLRFFATVLDKLNYEVGNSIDVVWESI